MSSDAFELLIYFFMFVWLISTIYEQYQNFIADCRKADEKREKRNNELARQQEKEAKETKERRAMIAARFEARAKAQAEEKHIDSELNK